MAAHIAAVALSLYQGEDYVAAGAHKVSGAPGAAAVDITGWTILGTVKVARTDTTAVLEINGVVTAGSTGLYALTIASADSADLAAGIYHVDVWRTNSGAKTALAIGTLTVYQPVNVGT